MTCYRPIKAFVIGNKLDGTEILKFATKEQRDQEFLYHNNSYYYDYYLLPCGQCLGCTIKRSKDWATRMMCELTYHDKACFVTLTYNDESMYNPELDLVSHYVDSNGELQESYTLRKRPFQLFMKRLRKHFAPQEIRFFACGEYGGKTRRPHYHAILYGIDFSEDRVPWQRNFQEDMQWRSPTLEKLWPYGFSLIAEVNMQTCAYVSRYCTKKRYGSQNMYYQTFNIEPEFNLMSRRPGIGKQWFIDNKDAIYENQEIFLSTKKGGVKVRPPSYYDKLYDITNPDESAVIKANRKRMSEEANKLKVESSGMNLYELLAAEEENFKKKVSSLRRDKV